MKSIIRFSEEKLGCMDLLLFSEEDVGVKSGE